MSSKFSVVIEKYAERHYIKQFAKKYKGRWDVTLEAIEALCAEPYDAIEYGKLETMIDAEGVLICKLNFAIAGTKRSPKRSGNRVIVAVDKEQEVTRILLVYHKNDLGKGNETQQWRKMVRESYPAYKEVV